MDGVKLLIEEERFRQPVTLFKISTLVCAKCWEDIVV